MEDGITSASSWALACSSRVESWADGKYGKNDQLNPAVILFLISG